MRQLPRAYGFGFAIPAGVVIGAPTLGTGTELAGRAEIVFSRASTLSVMFKVVSAATTTPPCAPTSKMNE